MVFTHTLGVTYKTDAGTITSTTDSYQADCEHDIDDSVPASTTNKEFDIAITKANIKSMVLYSDQSVTLKTNSTTSPTDTITMAAKKQVVWNTDSLNSCPFTSDITKIFVTNSTAAAAKLAIRFLLNQAP